MGTGAQFPVLRSQIPDPCLVAAEHLVPENVCIDQLPQLPTSFKVVALPNAKSQKRTGPTSTFQSSRRQSVSLVKKPTQTPTPTRVWPTTRIPWS
ncbi:hypothetical protein HYQ46_009901 [Verticillium longisporum]|nr:hypothetical protein HYQ46_009901 [Verticillium longisporum]